MGTSFDYFVGALECPSCGAVSEPDGRTYIQTRLRDDPEGAYLGVGDALELPSDIGACEYEVLREPTAGEPVHIGEVWCCPSCGAGQRWAEVVIAEGRIRSLRAVDLVEALPRLHAVCFDVVYLVQEATGLPLDALMRVDLKPWVERVLLGEGP